MTLRRSSHRAGARWFVLMGAVVAMTVLIGTTALATHNLASLSGSNFELDVDANLTVDDASPSMDWASVNEVRRADAPTGQNDDSYSGGTKEDDTCPGVGTGSIPNNKSDLLNFGVYTEPGAPGFLHLFWNRVAEPSGTTLMDFELNQSRTPCAEGRVNPVRTGDGDGALTDDLLIEYRIEQGGARAQILVREWSGTAWGPAIDLTELGMAAGTINSSPITSNTNPSLDASDGLGAMNARTFGEASIDLDFIFDANKCTSFGSAFLKSRASTSFTSQLKDYIAPQPINLTNCGKVIIRKQTDPDENPNTTTFGFTKSFGTDPTTLNTFSLADDGAETFNNVLLGNGYTVTEDAPPSGWQFVSVDCSASTGVTPTSVVGAIVTFDIDSTTDILDCTYTNRARGSIVIEKVTTGGTGTFNFGSSAALPAPAVAGAFSLETTAAGAGGKDSETFSNLVAGTVYDVTETVPAGWDLTNIVCSGGTYTVGTDSNTDFDAGDVKATITVPAGATVTCTYTNTREFKIIVITCNEQTSGLVDSTITMNGVSKETLTSVPTALANKGVTMADLCAIGGATFGDLALGSYALSAEVPDVAPLFPN